MFKITKWLERKRLPSWQRRLFETVREYFNGEVSAFPFFEEGSLLFGEREVLFKSIDQITKGLERRCSFILWASKKFKTNLWFVACDIYSYQKYVDLDVIIKRIKNDPVLTVFAEYAFCSVSLYFFHYRKFDSYGKNAVILCDEKTKKVIPKRDDIEFIPSFIDAIFHIYVNELGGLASVFNALEWQRKSNSNIAWLVDVSPEEANRFLQVFAEFVYILGCVFSKSNIETFTDKNGNVHGIREIFDEQYAFFKNLTHDSLINELIKVRFDK